MITTQLRSDMIFAKYLEELYKWYHNIHVDKDWASIPIITNIEENLGLSFVPAPFDSAQYSSGNVCMEGSHEVRDEYKDFFSPIDLLDYIYAVLYSSGNHEEFKEQLKIDFTQVPCPKDLQMFWKLVGQGSELRQRHLLE